MVDVKKIEELLCATFCANIHLRKVKDKSDIFFLETPFMFPDGDSLSLYLKEIPYGFRITDLAHTFMHLSYDNDTDAMRTGTRGRLLEQITSEFNILENNGELFVEVPPEELSSGLFRMGQGLTRITDLTFLNRARSDSTFYDDLYKAIISIVPPENVDRDYIVPNLPNGTHYPIDYRIEGKAGELFMFGIPNRDKAKLTTITLQQLNLRKIEYESLIVFEDQSTINRGDLSRLTNVAGEMISSLDAFEDMKRKVSNKGELLSFPSLN